MRVVSVSLALVVGRGLGLSVGVGVGAAHRVAKSDEGEALELGGAARAEQHVVRRGEHLVRVRVRGRGRVKG